VRVDAGVHTGTVVSPNYDPLLAKLMVVAADRPAAMARLARALDEFEIGGLQTTLPFHRWLIEQPAFRDAQDLSTDYVARAWRPADVMSIAVVRAAELAARVSRDRAVTSEAGAKADPHANGIVPSAWWRAGIAEATEGKR
jgi:acetyl-CoA/propionyl-CoA carboxylase biotin carboxyl carrier protein